VPEAWQDSVLANVRGFLNNPSFRSEEYRLLLKCHSSLAFVAGYELDRESGAQVFPVQQGVRTTAWRPGPCVEGVPANGVWSSATHAGSSDMGRRDRVLGNA